MNLGGQKLFSFRWDIDHRACITDGLPRVLEVCAEFGVKNTRFILETLLSRPVGRSFVDRLQATARAGHELGQHGGDDHVVWSRRFFELPESVIAADVAKNHAEFSALFGRPAGFTSPGFKSDERITKIVERLGFRYDGDAIGGTPHQPKFGAETARHWRIPVTISGPRTVPFLEWHGARGTPREQLIADLNRQLDGNDWVVLYGHPCYEGVEHDMLRDVFRTVLQRGFQFVTHQQMAERLSEAA